MTAESETVVVETRDRPDGVRVVTLNNPPVNAISSAMRRQLRDAMLEIDADDSVKGVVLTGAGRAFIAGADIREFGKPNPGRAEPDAASTLSRLQQNVRARSTARRPVAGWRSR